MATLALVPIVFSWQRYENFLWVQSRADALCPKTAPDNLYKIGAKLRVPSSDPGQDRYFSSIRASLRKKGKGNPAWAQQELIRLLKRDKESLNEKDLIMGTELWSLSRPSQGFWKYSALARDLLKHRFLHVKPGPSREIRRAAYVSYAMSQFMLAFPSGEHTRLLTSDLVSSYPRDPDVLDVAAMKLFYNFNVHDLKSMEIVRRFWATFDDVGGPTLRPVRARAAIATAIAMKTRTMKDRKVAMSAIATLNRRAITEDHREMVKLFTAYLKSLNRQK